MSDTKNIRDEAVIIDDINQELISLHSDNSDIAYSFKCGSVKWNLKPDWISVEDRLPMEADEGDSAYKCIVAYRSGNFSGTSVSWFEFSDEFNVGGFSGDITHWMELPEPPKTRSEL